MIGKISTYQFSELEEIMHAYAITVHKSQGSEFNNVILLIPNAMPKLLTRNLLYTALTRAKKRIDIFTSSNILNKMVDTIDIKKRKTNFKEELQWNKKK